MKIQIPEALRQPSGGPCITTIISFANLLREDIKGRLEAIRKAVKKAEELVATMFPEDTAGQLNSFLENYLSTYKNDARAQGTGIYLSAELQHVISFHFPVQDTITAGNKFYLREIRYIGYLSFPYYVLQLKQDAVMLYEGCFDRLQEIHEGNFPLRYTETYEYNQPAHTSSIAGYAGVKGFEKDKSILHNIRIEQFLRAADKHLSYIKDHPLILAGAEKELALFKKVSAHRKSFIGEVEGNYADARELEENCVDIAMQYRADKEHDGLMELLQQRWSSNMAAEGITAVWKAVKENRASTILMEKDYNEITYHHKNGALQVKPSKGAHTIVTDGVETLLDMAEEKKCRIIYVENGALQQYGKIAAMLRSK